jgi:hypothetical protein
LAQLGEVDWFESPENQTTNVRQTFGLTINYGVTHANTPENDEFLHYAFTQYSLKQGLRLAREATMREIQQLHDIGVFEQCTSYN